MIQLTGFSGFSDALKTTDAPTRFTEILTSIISTITIFAGLAFLFWFVIGAFTWITGGHDPAQLEKAKKQMGDAFIGLLATAAVLPITYLIGKLTGIDILAPENILNSLIPK
ncbi:MAG: hypothetical protein ABIJ43_00455 [Candidatus Beckwithbacteria bacterium]|nr:hypothetical protein [Patescibacteria group bacterium]